MTNPNKSPILDPAEESAGLVGGYDGERSPLQPPEKESTCYDNGQPKSEWDRLPRWQLGLKRLPRQRPAQNTNESITPTAVGSRRATTGVARSSPNELLAPTATVSMKATTKADGSNSNESTIQLATQLCLPGLAQTCKIGC